MHGLDIADPKTRDRIAAREARVKAILAEGLDPSRPLAKAQSYTEEIGLLMDNEDAVRRLFVAQLGREPKDDVELDLFRSKETVRLGREWREHSKVAEVISRRVEAREVLLTRFEPLFLSFAEGVRRVLKHYIKDEELLQQLLTGIAMQVELGIGKAGEIYDEETSK